MGNFVLKYIKKRGNMSKIEILTDEITQNPDDAESYINRGDWYYQQRDFENALYDYEKAVELGEDLDEDVCYLECVDFKRADEKIADFSKKIEKEPENINHYTARAYFYSLKKQYDKAISDISAAIKIAPSTILYHAQTVLCEDLIEYNLTKAIEIAEDEKKYTSYWFRGNHYKEKYLANKEDEHLLEQAEEDYQNAIACAKDKHSAYFEISRFYEDVENFEEAIKSCKSAVDAADAADEVLFLAKYTEQLAALFYETKDYERAVEYATKAISLTENEHSLMHLLKIRSDSYKQIGEHFKAFEDKERLEHLIAHHHCHDEHCQGQHE